MSKSVSWHTSVPHTSVSWHTFWHTFMIQFTKEIIDSVNENEFEESRIIISMILIIVRRKTLLQNIHNNKKTLLQKCLCKTSSAVRLSFSISYVHLVGYKDPLLCVPWSHRVCLYRDVFIIYKIFIITELLSG